jgi:hypothetical protein
MKLPNNSQLMLDTVVQVLLSTNLHQGGRLLCKFVPSKKKVEKKNSKQHQQKKEFHFQPWPGASNTLV